MPHISPAIALKSVAHKLPDGTALFTDLNVSFPDSRTGLVGRNGVGKSTLFNLIAGRLPVQAGNIHVSGRVRLLVQEPARIPGGTLADLFDIGAGLAQLARITAGIGTQDDFDHADWTLEARFYRSAGQSRPAGPGTRSSARRPEWRPGDARRPCRPHL